MGNIVGNYTAKIYDLSIKQEIDNIRRNLTRIEFSDNNDEIEKALRALKQAAYHTNRALGLME